LAKRTVEEVEVGGRVLALSNLDKVLWPAAGVTKRQLVAYYRAIAPAMLPHLSGHAITLKRYPDGVAAESFYEKNAPKHRPPWVVTAPIWSPGNDRYMDYCLAGDEATLAWMANLAAIELHTSLALATAPMVPTAMVFDLDPGPPADVALLLRRFFTGLGLELFPKTSGSKGLQLYVPLHGEATFEVTKAFAHAVAKHLEREHPELVLSRMSKALRAGKIFIDWSQNDPSKTTVNVYSVRARERPTVSTPISWEEVLRCAASRDGAPLVFELDAVLARVAERGDLFAPVAALHQTLPAPPQE
jgi:bifunctional non-homologous end joining protein LigD